MRNRIHVSRLFGLRWFPCAPYPLPTWPPSALPRAQLEARQQRTMARYAGTGARRGRPELNTGYLEVGWGAGADASLHPCLTQPHTPRTYFARSPPLQCHAHGLPVTVPQNLRYRFPAQEEDGLDGGAGGDDGFIDDGDGRGGGGFARRRFNEEEEVRTGWRWWRGRSQSQMWKPIVPAESGGLRQYRTCSTGKRADMAVAERLCGWAATATFKTNSGL